jgi:pyruvate dehydrogenase E2 component (dihydrolipoyllysine-residue acetyltransferase)
MATEVKLPELGENLEGGEVLDLKVAAGDTISEGQTLLEIEAEKSTVDVPAPAAGKLAQWRIRKGDKIKVGQTICVIEAVDGKAKAEPPKKAQPAEQKSEAPNKVPAPEEETQEKTPSATESERDGAAPSPQAEGGEGKATGSEALTEQEPSAPVTPPEAPSRTEAEETREKAVADVENKRKAAGPATRRLARELGVDLDLVEGSALHGRITMDDVKAYVRQLAGRTGQARRAPPLPDFSKWGQVTRQPLDPFRRRIGEAMSLAWTMAPRVTQYDQADITELDTFRRQQEASGPKLTPTAFALRAAASALKQFPQFNASLDEAAGQLILKQYYHIGVAVDTPRGLLVPVLRDVDKKSVRELAQELSEIAERARNKKVTAEEMRGGTFTITNLGGIGGTAFSPIVNYPEVAILGMARARLQPVVHNGEIVPRLILPLSVSYDHRVIDGADAARFTRRITEMLENPLQMLL